jgi:hypothetical protein
VPIRYLAKIIITLLVSVLAISVELFRYRYGPHCFRVTTNIRTALVVEQTLFNFLGRQRKAQKKQGATYSSTMWLLE